MIRITIDQRVLQSKLRRMPAKMRSFVYSRLKRKTDESVSNLKKVAPKKTGLLKQSIFGRTYNKPLRVQIGLPKLSNGGFDYGQFATGQAVIVTQSPHNKYFRQGQTLIYGQRATAPSGKPIKWSAQATWWTGFEQSAPKIYKATLQRAISDFAANENIA